MDYIKFYKVNDAYGCFSNFAPYGFYLKNAYWSTSEHYFQAMKFENTIYEERVRAAKTPMEAANLGRNRDFPLRSDWELIKDDVMRQAVSAKFLAHESLRKILLDTNDVIIIEDTKDDYYWGCGKEGYGKNMLGKILMEVREDLRTKNL